MRRAFVSASLFAALAGRAMPAAAERAVSEPRGVPVKLSFEGCPPPLTTEVERIARIELHAPVGASSGSTTQIELACEGDDARIAVDDPLTGKRSDRALSLAHVPEDDRARLLALALAELVRASWIELELTPVPALPLAHPTEARQADKDRALEVARARRHVPWHASAALEGLEIPSVGRPVLGASLGMTVDLVGPLWVDGSVTAWDGATERKTGSINLRQIALDPAVGVRLSVVDLGVAARVAWASLSGTPSVTGYRGESVAGVVFAPTLTASVRVYGPLRVWLKGGVFVRTLRGEVTGDSDVLVGGPWASLGLGLRLPP